MKCITCVERQAPPGCDYCELCLLAQLITDKQKPLGKESEEIIMKNPTFDELMQAGFEAEAYVIEGIPMVFQYRGCLVAYDKNDDCFLFSRDGVTIEIYEGN